MLRRGPLALPRPLRRSLSILLVIALSLCCMECGGWNALAHAAAMAPPADAAPPAARKPPGGAAGGAAVPAGTPPAAPPATPPATPPQPPPPAAAEPSAPPEPPPLEGPPPPLPDVTTASIAEARERASASTEIDDETRQRVLETYDRALQRLAAARQQEERTRQFNESRAAAPGLLEQIRAELAQPAEVAVVVPEGATLVELQQSRDEAVANLRLAEERLGEIDRDAAQRAERRSVIPTELAAARSALEDLEARIAASSGGAASSPLASAEFAERLARRAELLSTIEVLRAEQLMDEAVGTLDSARRERAQRRISTRQALLKEWRSIVDRRAAMDAAAEATSARRAAAEASPVVRSIAERTLQLIEQRTGESGLIASNAASRQHLDRVETRLRSMAIDYARDRDRALSSGNIALSNLRLQNQRAALPALGFLRTGEARLRDQLAAAQLELAELESEQAAMPPTSVRRDQILASLGNDIAPELLPDLRIELDRRLGEERSQLDALVAAYREREEWLLRIQERLVPLIALTRTYGDFINQRILWIRSMPALGFGDMGRSWDSIQVITMPATWRTIGRQLWNRAINSPVRSALIVLILAAWLVRRRAIQQRFERLAEKATRVHTDHFGLTAAATGLTILDAAVLPGVLWFLAWLLNPALEPALGTPLLPDGASDGLERAAWVLLSVSLLRSVVRPAGLAAAHFRWRNETRQIILRQVRWFTPLVLPLSFIIGAADWAAREAGDDSFGRLAFVVAMGLTAVFAWRLFRPGRSVLDGVVAGDSKRWLGRLQWLIRAAIVGAPVALGILAGLGWFSTALQLEIRLLGTGLLVLGALVANGLVLRWLYIARRRLAMEEVRKKRAAMLEADADAGQAASAEGGTIQVDEPGIDLSAIDAQTRQLLRTALALGLVLGVFAIWARMLPALAMLNRIEVWPQFLAIRESEIVPPSVGEILGPSAARLLGTERSGAAAAPSSTTGSTSGTAPITPGEPSNGPPASPAVPSPAAANGSAPTGSGDLSAGSGAGSGGAAAPRQSGIALPGPLASLTPGGGSSESANGTSATRSDRSIITVGNLIVSLLAVIVTVVLARNIPGLLEITLLQRLPMETSVRYAVTAITRYVVTVVGIVIAFGSIGIGWSQVQWLVAAITVGVGFGLQEIVANLVSGVIILFEQPVRVGDTVTVGNVSGTVTRIRMRATTITDWDRKELIIPNKEFITGQVINWTLSDSTLRIVLPVGVAYGSDVVAVERLLVSIAHQHPNVLAEPSPAAVFMGFGDSTLNFELRCILPALDNSVRTRHELNVAIDREFRAAGIEIAFPQRDIHVRGMEGTLRIERAARPGALAAGSPTAPTSGEGSIVHTETAPTSLGQPGAVAAGGTTGRPPSSSHDEPADESSAEIPPEPIGPTFARNPGPTPTTGSSSQSKPQSKRPGDGA